MRGTLRNNLGFTFLGLGDARAAEATFEAALVFRRKSGDRRGELISLNNLGSTRRLLGLAGPAEEAHRQALAIADELGDARQQGISRLRLAELALARGQAEPALRELELEISLPLGDWFDAALGGTGIRLLALSPKWRKSRPTFRSITGIHRVASSSPRRSLMTQI